MKNPLKCNSHYSAYTKYDPLRSVGSGVVLRFTVVLAVTGSQNSLFTGPSFIHSQNVYIEFDAYLPISDLTSYNSVNESFRIVIEL